MGDQMARRHREQVRPEALLHQRPDAGEPVAADLFLARSQQGEQRGIGRGIEVDDAIANGLKIPVGSDIGEVDFDCADRDRLELGRGTAGFPALGANGADR